MKFFHIYLCRTFEIVFFVFLRIMRFESIGIWVRGFCRPISFGVLHRRLYCDIVPVVSHRYLSLTVIQSGGCSPYNRDVPKANGIDNEMICKLPDRQHSLRRLSLENGVIAWLLKFILLDH